MALCCSPTRVTPTSVTTQTPKAQPVQTAPTTRPSTSTTPVDSFEVASSKSPAEGLTLPSWSKQGSGGGGKVGSVEG